MRGHSPSWFLALAILGFLLGLAPPAEALPTPLRSWAPSVSGVRFKTAAACYDSRDVYVVAAVFSIPYGSTTYDALYKLRIQGSSTSGSHGELIAADWVRSEWRIDNVDCASSGGGNIFVAFDRLGASAAFYRWDGSAVAGPFDLGHCETLRAYKPRIAYGGGRVMVAYTGDNLDGSPASISCGVCSKQFAQSGALLVENIEFWRESTHTDYDVEHNGSQFMLAVQWRSDGWYSEDSALSTLRYDAYGNEVSETMLQYFTTGSSPAAASRVRLVHSPNARNTFNRMFLQTDKGSYWVNTAGALVGSPVAYNAGTRFGLCEYWGADNAVATLFTESLTWTYTGGYPFGSWVPSWRTARSHFGTSPAAPYETSTLNAGYVPTACKASFSYTDSEVLLVSQTPGSSGASINWNLQTGD